MILFLSFGVCYANEVFATLRTSQHSAMSLSAVRIDALFEHLIATRFLFSQCSCSCTCCSGQLRIVCNKWSPLPAEG